MSDYDYKTIKIKRKTHERLRFHGKMGESFDNLINKLLDNWEAEKSEKRADSISKSR